MGGEWAALGRSGGHSWHSGMARPGGVPAASPLPLHATCAAARPPTAAASPSLVARPQRDDVLEWPREFPKKVRPPGRLCSIPSLPLGSHTAIPVAWFEPPLVMNPIKAQPPDPLLSPSPPAPLLSSPAPPPADPAAAQRLRLWRVHAAVCQLRGPRRAAGLHAGLASAGWGAGVGRWTHKEGPAGGRKPCCCCSLPFPANRLLLLPPPPPSRSTTSTTSASRSCTSCCRSAWSEVAAAARAAQAPCARGGTGSSGGRGGALGLRPRFD